MKDKFIQEFPKLKILDDNKFLCHGGVYKLNDYIVKYPFKEERNSPWFLNQMGRYAIADYEENSLISSEGSIPDGIILSVNYIEFLRFLKKSHITLETEVSGFSGMYYKFLSYPNSIVSKIEQCILDELYSIGGSVKGIGTLYKNGNKYHIGNQEVLEYDSYLVKNKGKKVNYVRMKLNDGKYYWVRVSPIIWSVDSNINLLYTKSAIIPFDLPFNIDVNKYTEYINNILYPELNYHPEQYLSKKLINKIDIWVELHKYNGYLIDEEEYSNRSKSKILKK